MSRTHRSPYLIRNFFHRDIKTIRKHLNKSYRLCAKQLIRKHNYDIPPYFKSRGWSTW